MQGGAQSGTKVHLRLVITGRVQGVGFRAFTQREAERLGVSGWVANRADGRVEAVVEGERAAVEAIVAWCRKGPPAAAVRSVDVVSGFVEGLSGFKVLKSSL